VVFDKAYLDDPPTAAYNYWVNGEFNAAPNGSLMRTHPLGVICMEKSHGETFRIATEFSLVTHADPRCVVACCISTALIRGILRGEIQSDQDIDAVIDVAFEWVSLWQKRGRRFEEDLLMGTDDEWVDASVKKYDGGDEEEQSSTNKPGKSDEQHIEREPLLNRSELYRHVKAKDFQELQLDDSMKMGYVYKSLGAAILALRRAIHHDRGESSGKGESFSRNTFENLITEIVMEGGDADTNACIAGALLGAWLGYTALPAHWRDGIEHHDWLLSKCAALSCTIGIAGGLGGYKGSEDLDAMEDGGRGFLDKGALEAREMAFMEMYLRKRVEDNVVERKKKVWKVKLFS
jgi:ADP-ribosylglycohydrolase